MFGSYLKKQNIIVSLEETLSETGILNCRVRQESIIGPILFLLYVNDMKTELKNCGLRLYAGDTCILYSHQYIKFIERNLNYDFNNLYEWFIDNKLSLHFGEDKTKSILFKRGNKSNLSLSITWNENVTKQHSVVGYLGCWKYIRKAMARMDFKKVNGKKKFL